MNLIELHRRRSYYSSSTTPIVPTYNIISYYKMESNVLDSKGTNNGTGTSVTYGVGKIGTAAIFNGSTSKVICASSSFDFWGTQNLSINCWVKFNALPSSYLDLICISEANAPTTLDKSIRIYNDGSAGFYGYDGSVKVAKSVSGIIAINNWYMLTGDYDGISLRIYINAVLKATIVCSATFNMTNAQLTIGKTDAGTLNGMIDEISIHNATLSQNNIDTLYNSGNGITL